MKTTSLFLWLFISIFSLPSTGIGQCTVIQQITHDTIVTSGGTTGGVPFNFAFPKFDGGTGTLLNVQIASVVTLRHKYDIENKLASFRNHQTRIDRYDDLTSSSIPGYYIGQSITTPWHFHALQAANGVPGSGPDFGSEPTFYILNQDTFINVTLYNTADYIGIDSVYFDYNTTMFQNASVGAEILNAVSDDQIKFIVSYTYCNSVMLDADNRPARITRTPTDRDVKIPGIRLFPNPSTNGNIIIEFDKTKRSDWQVEIFSTSGQLIAKKQFNSTLIGRMNTDSRLASGIYLVRATNKKTQEKFTERLLINN